MSATLHGVFMLIFSVFQATWLDYIEVFSVKPNMFLVYVIIICSFCKKSEGAGVGFAFGIVLDMLIGRFWGLNALFMMLLGFFTAHFCERLLRDNNLLISLLLVFVVSFLYETLYGIISYPVLGNSGLGPMFLKIIIPESFYNIVVAIPLHFVLKRIAKVLYSDKGESIG